MRIVPLPPNADLEHLLSGLTQREVKVKAAEGAPRAPSAVALYRTDAPVIEVAALFDLELAGSLAAALTLVPAGAVREGVAAGALEESLQQNLAEVMNVLSRFVSMSGRRFALVGTWCPPGMADPAVMQAALAADETRTVAVEVPGYPGGMLTFNTL